MWMPRASANFFAAVAMIGDELARLGRHSEHPHSLHPDEQRVDGLAPVDDDDLDLGPVALEGAPDPLAEPGLGIGAQRRA